MNPVNIAAAMRPAIEHHSADIEAQRRVPQTLADEMSAAGLFRLLVPRDYGGEQVHPQTFFDTLQTLAAADAAVGWVGMIGTTTGLLSASLPKPWAEEIYVSNPDVITVGVTAPIGKAHVVDGGLQVTGRWPFGSGSQVANWICGGCTLSDRAGPKSTAGHSDGPPAPLLAFFPADEVTIHTDTWDTSGLRGTGSHDIEVVDAFVPEGRWVVLGKRALIDAPLYRFPTFGLLALGVSAVSLGIAQRAVEEFIELAGSKTPTGASRSLANRPMVQRDLAVASADLESARAFTRAVIDEAYDVASTGDRLETPVKAKLRLAASNNAWSAVRVVDALYHAAGGSAIYSRNKLQQCFRDVHVATQHIMVGQPTFEVVGKVMLGLDPKQPL